MDDIAALEAEARANESKTVYDMYKATNGTASEWDLPTLNGGGSAHATILGKTLTLNYTDGTMSTYTEPA
jgi:hypothetical protein